MVKILFIYNLPFGIATVESKRFDFKIKESFFQDIRPQILFSFLKIFLAFNIKITLFGKYRKVFVLNSAMSNFNEEDESIFRNLSKTRDLWSSKAKIGLPPSFTNLSKKASQERKSQYTISSACKVEDSQFQDAKSKNSHLKVLDNRPIEAALPPTQITSAAFVQPRSAETTDTFKSSFSQEENTTDESWESVQSTINVQPEKVVESHHYAVDPVKYGNQDHQKALIKTQTIESLKKTKSPVMWKLLIAAAILLAVIFGLTGLIKSEQIETLASAAAVISPNQFSGSGEHKDIGELEDKIEEIEKHAVADRAKTDNSTDTIMTELKAIRALNEEITKNMSLLQEENKLLHNNLEALSKSENKSVSPKALGPSVDEIDDLKEELRKTSEKLTTAENTLKALNSSIFQINTSFVEYKTTVEAAKALEALEAEKALEASEAAKALEASNLKNLNTSLIQLNTSFVEYKATSSQRIQAAETSITALESKTAELEQLLSSLKAESFANDTALRTDIDGNTGSIASLETTVNNFITVTYKENFNQIALGIGRLEDVHGMWHYGFNGYIYQKTVVNATHDAAEASCQGFASELAHLGIRDLDTRWRIARNTINDDTQPYWIGINDRETAGTWKWNDGTVANIDDILWASDQPDNPSHHCAGIVGGIYQYLTYDTSCAREMLTLCEKQWG